MNRSIRRLATALTTICIAATVIPATAFASTTVGLENGALHVASAPGARNQISISELNGLIVVSDTWDADLVPGVGCSTVGDTVECPTDSITRGVYVSTGDGPDDVSAVLPSWKVRIDAGDGNDEVFVQAAAAYASLGAGEDGFAGGAQNDHVDGGPDDDHLVGDDGNDTFWPGAGDDVVLTGASGVNTVHASPGADHMDFNGSAAAVSYRNRIAGVQVIDDGAANDGRAGEHDNVLNAGSLSVAGGIGDDYLTGTPGVDQLDGGAGDDAMWGLGGNDVVYGRAGDDLANTGGGFDTIDVGTGNDMVLAGLQSDDVTCGSGRDRISYADHFTSGVVASLAGGGMVGEADVVTGCEDLVGTGGNDTLSGNELANVILGGGGNDSVSGLAGDDRIEGGPGKDTLDGGSGDDRIEAKDGYADVVRGGTGTDTARLDSFIDTKVGIESIFA